MTTSIIEHPNFIDSFDLNFIEDSILSNTFPWYWGDRTTTKGFPFLGHTLLSRREDDPNSSVFGFFNKILIEFCNFHGIKLKKILRGSLNLTYHFDKKYGDPHVDYPFDINQCIMYLNSCDDGETLVFREEYGSDGYTDEIYPLNLDKKFTVKCKISPLRGKVLHYYGKNFHTHSWCRQGQRRVVCVFNFL